MSSKPSQTRTIDPFAEYNSNVANRLTRMLTQNDNVLLSTNSLRLTLDSTSPTTVAVVQTGTVFKDDVMIEITADHRVDFEDASNYVSGVGPLDELGYYYVVLEYTYVKSRPAPDVDIKILHPDEKAQLSAGSLMLLGVVNVVLDAPNFRIDISDPFYDYDDTLGYEDNKREYVKFYAGTETNLPIHETFRDQSRVAYEYETDKFWIGYKDRWEQINAGSSINIDTTSNSVVIGDLCYVNASGEAQKSISTAVGTRAEFAALEIGTSVDGSGQGRLYGIVESVPVDSTSVMNVGDVCYLSSTEAGKVTNVKSITGGYQNVGKCLAVNGSIIDLLFIPGDFLNITQSISETLSSGGSWLGGGPYYQDVDITSIGSRDAVVVVRDTADNYVIQPEELEFTSTTNLRVWMPVNTLTLRVTVVG